MSELYDLLDESLARISSFLILVNCMHFLAIARTTGFHSLSVFSIVLLSIGQGFLKVFLIEIMPLSLFADQKGTID